MKFLRFGAKVKLHLRYSEVAPCGRSDVFDCVKSDDGRKLESHARSAHHLRSKLHAEGASRSAKAEYITEKAPFVG